jgi:hypothetical protein
MYTLAATLRLWDAPHYRATSFAQDLRDNLCNIAIPGTGALQLGRAPATLALLPAPGHLVRTTRSLAVLCVAACAGMPLSVWCRSRAAALIFIVAVNPVVSLAAAVLTAVLQQPQPRQQPASPDVAAGALAACSDISATYHSLLLEPQHWFAVWRHNCLLVGLHALRTGSASYGLENKGAFLREGSRLGLPVSPFYADAAAVFVKHVAIEGGMGIHHFRWGCGQAGGRGKRVHGASAACTAQRPAAHAVVEDTPTSQPCCLLVVLLALLLVAAATLRTAGSGSFSGR